MTQKNLHRQNVVACIWDFDKTLIPGYMQAPIFEAYGIDQEAFWREVTELPKIYAERGTRVSSDTIYLNHLLSYVKNGALKGLTNQRLRELGKELVFYPGLPDLFEQLKARGAIIYQEPANYPWAYQMIIGDPDGNRLIYGSGPRDDKLFQD